MPGEFIRSFAKFFTNLNPSEQQEIERIFDELQNSKEITSLDESLRQLRRKPNQRLPVPVLTATTTVRGAVVEWEALPDQRVNFYEADVSSTSNFASFSTIPTFGISVVIDGLTGTKFVRVRGVRRDGTTTPYSETTTITPVLFDIRSHSEEDFYVRIQGTNAVVVLGGDGTDLDYTPINPDGNSMCWGFLTTYADPAVSMFGTDAITAKVIVKVVSSSGATVSETTHWQMSMGEHFNSHGIGPFHIAHPELNQSLEVRLEVRDQTVKEDLSTRTSDATEVTWAHLNILEIGST